MLDNNRNDVVSMISVTRFTCTHTNVRDIFNYNFVGPRSCAYSRSWRSLILESLRPVDRSKLSQSIWCTQIYWVSFFIFFSFFISQPSSVTFFFFSLLILQMSSHEKCCCCCCLVTISHLCAGHIIVEGEGE